MPPTDRDRVIAAARFRALGDETRLRLLEALTGGECNVAELMERMGLGQSLISHHLRSLREAGLAPPALSAAYVSTYPWVWTGPVLVVLVAVFGGRLRYWLAGVVGMVSMLLWGSFAVLAMYLSLFVQAAAV